MESHIGELVESGLGVVDDDQPRAVVLCLQGHRGRRFDDEGRAEGENQVSTHAEVKSLGQNIYRKGLAEGDRCRFQQTTAAAAERNFHARFQAFLDVVGIVLRAALQAEAIATRAM